MAGDREVMPEARPRRLFVAADVPSDVKAGLSEATRRFRDRIPGARWTREDGWHVTLKFLGSTWPRLEETVRDAVAEAASAAAPFPSALTEMGVFASPARTRVVWVALSDPEERFAALARRLNELLEADFTPEARELTPHLTLARLNPPRNVREFAPDLVGLAVPSREFVVDALVLYQSHLSPKGASYEALTRFPFGG
jgi:2'-5' RNA ligase